MQDPDEILKNLFIYDSEVIDKSTSCIEFTEDNDDSIIDEVSDKEEEGGVKEEHKINSTITINDKDKDELPITSNDIKFVLDTISKQAPFDKVQIKQIFYGICSSQTSTKIHHNINSKKSGEGKSYLLKLVVDFFPDSFILKFNNMSDKALFHLDGIEAIKNEETGKYEKLSPILHDYESKREEIVEKIEEEKGKGISKNSQLIKSLKDQIKNLDEEGKEIKSKAVKIIDLDNKAFIFLDTPNENLFNNLMSLLSQDARDQLYVFTDKDSSGKRLKSKTVLLRGSPLIMTTQVVDDTRNYRFQEKNRRFIHVNPNTTENKIQEAKRQIATKLSGPPDDFESVVSVENIKKSKEIVKKLCENLKEHNQKLLDNDITGNGVKIPYSSLLSSCLTSSDAWSMTILSRLLNYIAIITKVNMESRPKVVDIETGLFYPISIYGDLKEALEIMKTASLSIRPYQQDWLTNVFLPGFEDLSPEPNYKTNYYGDIIEKESVIGLTTKQIADIMNKQGTNISITQIYENYLRPLIKQGVINSTRSVLNSKENLYYPVNQDNVNNISILPLTEDCHLILNQSFDERNILEESLVKLLERRSKDGSSKKFKIIDAYGKEISLENFIEKYFFNLEYDTSCSVILKKFHNSSLENWTIESNVKEKK